jgi:hypothetical protein
MSKIDNMKNNGNKNIFIIYIIKNINYYNVNNKKL